VVNYVDGFTDDRRGAPTEVAPYDRSRSSAWNLAPCRLRRDADSELQVTVANVFANKPRAIVPRRLDPKTTRHARTSPWFSNKRFGEAEALVFVVRSFWDDRQLHGAAVVRFAISRRGRPP